MKVSRQHSSLRRLVTLVMTVLVLGTLFTAAHAQEAPSVSIVSPQDGESVTSTDITVEFEHSGFDDACQLLGAPDQEGQGHIHAMVGGASMAILINMYCETDTITITGTGLQPGEQTIILTVASNSHMDMMESATEVTIDYQPVDPAPMPEEEVFDDPPVVRITNLEDGATVGPNVTLELEAENFNAAEELEGKPNLRGYGHYHVMLDMPMEDGMPDMANMSMEGMLAMPGDETLELDLSAWPEGEHSLVVMAANNDHTPIMPSEMAMLMFTLDHGDGDAEADVEEPALPAAGGGGMASAGESGLSLTYSIIAAAVAVAMALGGFATWMRLRAS